MRAPTLVTLTIIAALAGPVWAQEAEEETTAEEVMEEEMAEEGTEDTMSEEAMEEEMADDTMTEEATDDAVPSLEEIAAGDPALEIREGEDGEADAMVMLADVLFAFGDASLSPAALEVLAGIGEKLDGVAALEITGHTDSVGDEAFNLDLGQRRADAVRDWLVANTPLTAEVITARGVGEADPIAPNLTDDGADNPEGRALNRRVEFTLPDAG